MPIQGGTRFRKLQMGTQASFASNTSASRILPWRGPIVVQPNRTLPDVDLGSIDPILASYNGPTNITQAVTGKAAFDDMPDFWGALLKGGVTPTALGGGAYRWTWQAASLSADAYDYKTAEWGDEVNTDVYVAGGGIIDSGEVGFGDDLSAWDLSGQAVYARGYWNSNGFTGGLTIDATPNWIYGADTIVYLDSTAAAIGDSPLVDAVHAARLSINGNNDQKRFANGSNTRFQLAGFMRGGREGSVVLTVSKTTATMAEKVTLDDEPVPTRFLQIKTISPEIITGSTPYSQTIWLPVELIEAPDGEINANSTFDLTYRIKYNSTLGYAYKVEVVNSRSAL